MRNEQKDEIIEEWMANEYPELSDIRDLELIEGVSFVCKLGRLLDIAEENLTKHNSSSKKDCYNFECDEREEDLLKCYNSKCSDRRSSPS